MGRSLFVGDVHGCARELGELLELLGPTSDDRVYFVGDLVARGPDSAGVLRIFREIGAKGVLGNHEARLLEVRRARLSGSPGPRVHPSHESLLQSFTGADWAVLETLPLYVDVEEHGVRVIHAGVNPRLAFPEQDAWTLTNIRSVTVEGKASHLSGDESWAAAYRTGAGPHIVFGHDARRGLQLHSAATGLDTACVYGGSLTALVVPRGEPLPFPDERRGQLLSVRAKQRYYATEAGMA
jgi:hypothetical protein